VDRSRLLLSALLVVTCGVMAVPPLVNHFKPARGFDWPLYAGRTVSHQPPPDAPGNKDYPLWYQYGRMVVEDADLRTADGGAWLLYPTDPGRPFPFMYPPFAAVCLGVLSLLGPTGMLVTLILLNVLSLAVVAELSVRMVAGTGSVSVWLRVIPTAVCLFFVSDMFLLGQPNLGLLALVLGGLMLTRGGTGQQVAGGGLFALATAIKAFPAVVIVYLLWRRQWVAAASMVGFGLLFFVGVPAAVRGWDRTTQELRIWANGMLFRQGENGHGQRPEQSMGWRNQALFGVSNRLLSQANARAEETANERVKQLVVAPIAGTAAPVAAAVRPGTAGQPMYVNVVDLGYTGAILGALVAAGLLGLGFVLLMPRKRHRTRDTDAAEFAMLVILMTIGTPYAFGYYFVWLLYPLTVLVHHALKPGGRPAWVAVAGVVALFALSGAVVVKYVVPLAYGTLFWAAVVALAGCGWALVRGRRSGPASRDAEGMGHTAAVPSAADGSGQGPPILTAHPVFAR
jgi:hypothetical protein